MFTQNKWSLFKCSLKFWWQRRTRGFSDDETWSLCGTIAKFALPRLKRFKEINNGYPTEYTEEEWNDVIDKIIRSFEICVKEDSGIVSTEEAEEAEKGLMLFGLNFRNLWW